MIARNMEYIVTRTCAACKQMDDYPVTKVEAAFELYDFWNIECSKCGSNRCMSLIHPKPELDEELLDLWGQNPKWQFCQQDEDIILAQMDNLPLLLKAVDQALYTEQKQNVIISALCVLLYDNIDVDDNLSDQEKKAHQKKVDTVLPELLKRKKIIENSKAYIMPYIKRVVFPTIGLKN